MVPYERCLIPGRLQAGRAFHQWAERTNLSVCTGVGFIVSVPRPSLVPIFSPRYVSERSSQRLATREYWT